LDDLPSVGFAPNDSGDAGRNKNESRQVPEDRDSHDSTI